MHHQTASGLVYADIGESLALNQQRHQQTCPPCLDDTPTEYAELKHNLLSDKYSNDQKAMNGTYISAAVEWAVL